MKVLHVLYSGLGGHGNVFFSMVKADDRKEFEFEAMFNGIEEVREDYIRNCNVNSIGWSFIKKTPGKHFSFFWKMVKAIRASKADVVFLHGSIFAIPAKLATLFSGRSQKIIVRETQANHLKSKNEWRALKTVMIAADKVVFLSEEYRNEVRKILGRNFKEHKSVVIPNGLDIDFYRPRQKTKMKPLIISMQSRLVSIKDHVTLIKAFAKIKASTVEDIRLKIAGDGETKKALEELTISLKLSNYVEFTGMLNEEELLSFLQSTDIYVHASLGETMSTAIMQAMACGLPIIASDVPGINNMIADGKTGLLVPARDEEKLASLIQFLLNNVEKADELAKAGYEYAVKNFGYKQMLEKYRLIFN